LISRTDAAAMPTITSRPVDLGVHGSTIQRPLDAPPAPTSPARELARRALDVLRRARQASPPRSWLEPRFGREVDLVRLHLAPVRTRAGLAASFGREAFNVRMPERTPGATSIGPVDVAYTMRWLELGDGRRRTDFNAWLTDAGERTAQMNRSSTR
jgi:hypothetical protein